MGDTGFTADDITTLTTLASQAAVAIENARLFQQSDFIAELVHELRNPLAALKTSLTLLERPELPADKRADIIETMKGEAERLRRLTDEFLDLARLESGRESLSIETFPLQRLITESADVVQSQAQEKGITIHIDPEDYMVRADRGKIKQVVLNFLTNAIKYNRPNGEIYVRTQPVTDNDGRAWVQIGVEDTGYGISKEHQRNMFQKFYRVPALQDKAKGTGLGLAITKHIVEAHEGRIWLESEEGVGSTFFFTIPAAN
jgi:signal transduction histidine kinase